MILLSSIITVSFLSWKLGIPLNFSCFIFLKKFSKRLSKAVVVIIWMLWMYRFAVGSNPIWMIFPALGLGIFSFSIPGTTSSKPTRQFLGTSYLILSKLGNRPISYLRYPYCEERMAASMPRTPMFLGDPLYSLTSSLWPFKFWKISHRAYPPEE